METAETQNNINGVEWLVRYIVICWSRVAAPITEEPDDARVTSGSVGSAVRKGGPYPEPLVLSFRPVLVELNECDFSNRLSNSENCRLQA